MIELFVSVLYREPKVLKPQPAFKPDPLRLGVSVLYREPKVLKRNRDKIRADRICVSVLYREPKVLKRISVLL